MLDLFRYGASAGELYRLPVVLCAAMAYFYLKPRRQFRTALPVNREARPTCSCVAAIPSNGISRLPWLVLICLAIPLAAAAINPGIILSWRKALSFYASDCSVR